MIPFATINSDIDLRDFPSPEPVDTANNFWLLWGFLLVPVVLLTFWLMHRRRHQTAASIDPLNHALQHASDSNLSVRDRFQALYTALRRHLANKHDAAWNYLTADELKSFNFPAVQGFERADNLREQWLQLESLAYCYEEISVSQLNAVVELAKNLLQIKNEKERNSQKICQI